MLSLPVGLVYGENNRRGYVRRSCSVGLMDGGSIPPGSTTPGWRTTGCAACEHPQRTARAMSCLRWDVLVRRIEWFERSVQSNLYAAAEGDDIPLRLKSTQGGT